MSDITFNKLVSLAELFHPETFYDETSWLDLGKILYHHQHNYFNLLSNQIMLDTWINISKKTPGFEKTAHDDCTIEWKNFVIDHYFIVTSNQYNYESLVKYVKMDNPEGYARWEEDQMKIKKESSTNKYREQFNKFREECIDENFLYTRAITIDQIYKHYIEWRKTDDNIKISKKILQEFIVDKYGPIQYCKSTYNFGWCGIMLNDIKIKSEPLVMDIIEDEKKVSFKLPYSNTNKNKNVFMDEYDLMEKQPCEIGTYSPIPGGKGLNLDDYTEFVKSEEIETDRQNTCITYKSTNHLESIIYDTDSDEFVFYDKEKEKEKKKDIEIPDDNVVQVYDESEYLHEEDFLGHPEITIPIPKMKLTRKKKNYRKKDKNDNMDENEKEKGIHKKKKVDPIHKSSVRKQIKTYLKATTEKCDDGYISLEMLKDDYLKYCYYRGIPRETYFENIIQSIMGDKKSFYIDGEYYTDLFWGYKFKSIKNE